VQLPIKEHNWDEAEVEIAIGEAVLHGDLRMPHDAVGLVAFAHGSGSSRASPRNRQVADTLNREGLATLLLDMLSEEEETVDRETAELRFDIELLGERMVGTVDWLARQEVTADLALGLFGAGTGAAAALNAAAARPDRVAALVSRGGRPDMAAQALPRVLCPVLLIVGALDTEVLELNRRAAAQLAAPHAVELVDGATHLFEEPGALDQVAAHAADWFVRNLAHKAI
jgi:dienelactone hydrolase